MATKKKLVKITIIFILIFFVAVTGLSMIVPYIGGNKNIAGTGDVLSGDAAIQTQTGTDFSGTDLSGSTK